MKKSMVVTKLALLVAACVNVWIITRAQSAHDMQVWNVGFAFFTVTLLGLFNMMPIGHGVGRFKCFLGMPIKLMFFYVGFSVPAILLLIVADDPLLAQTVRQVGTLGIAVLISVIFALVDWYFISRAATSYSPPEDNPDYALNSVTSRVAELAKGTAPKK